MWIPEIVKIIQFIWDQMLFETESGRKWCVIEELRNQKSLTDRLCHDQTSSARRKLFCLYVWEY